MEMRRSPRCDVTDEEWRPLATFGICGVMQRRRNRHSPDCAGAARAGGGGKDAIDEARCAMRFQRCEMGIKIHSFGLSLLLINVCDPHQRCTSRSERSKNLRDQEVRNNAGIQRTRAEHDQVSLLNCCDR